MAGTVYSDYQKGNLRIQKKNLGVDVSRFNLDPEIKTLIGDIANLLLSPYDQNLPKTKQRIRDKQVQVLKELANKLQGRLKTANLNLESSVV